MRFLVLQHLEVEPPAMIGDILLEEAHTLETVRIHTGDKIPAKLGGYAGLIAMGGPMSANDVHLTYIRDEIRLLMQAVGTDFPVLGICLGAQLLAKAAGANIVPSPVRELGWYRLFPTPDARTDALFSSLPADGLDVFQWHGETFLLPKDATLLASCPKVPNQAFRLGSCQYGLQFHVEVDETTIHQWIEAGESERTYLGEKGVQDIFNASRKQLSTMQQFCDIMCRNWLALARKRMEKGPSDGS